MGKNSGSKLSDYIFNTKKLLNVIEKVQNNQNPSFYELSYFEPYKKIYLEGVTNLVNKFYGKTDVSHLIDLFYNVADDKALNDLVTNAIVDRKEDAVDFLKKPREEQLSEIKNNLIQKFDNDDQKENLVANVRRLFKDNFMLSKDCFNRVVNYINNVPEVTIEDLIPSKIEYSNPFELSEEENVERPYEKTIDEVYSDVVEISMSDSKNYTKILDALNDSNEILKVANISSTSIGGDIAEKAARSQERMIANQVMEDYQNDPSTKDKFEGLTPIEFKKTTTREEINEIARSIANDPGSNCFDDKTKERLISLYKMMDKDGMIPQNIAESGKKAYVFAPLLDARAKLENTIKDCNDPDKECDYEDLVKYQKEYRDTEKKLDRYLKYVKLMDSEGRFVSNISPSRDREIPFKYRKDFANASNLNALSFMFRIVKDSNISIEEFLDNPLKHYSQISNSFIENSDIFRYFKDTPKHQKLLDVYSSEEEGLTGINGVGALASKIPGTLNGLDRAYQGLACFIKDNEKRREFETKINTGFMALATKPLHEQSDSLTATFTSLNGVDFAERLRAVMMSNSEKDTFCSIDPRSVESYNHRTFEKMDNSPAEDRAKAINNTSSFLLETLENYVYLKDHNVKNTGPYVKAFYNIDIHILDKNKSNTYKKVAEALKADELGNITKTEFANLKAEAKFETLGKNGFNKYNAVDALKEIASLKKAHDNRNFFAKIFYSSVREQNKIYNKMVERLTESGLTKEQIDKCVQSINSNEQKGIEEAINLSSTLTNKSIQKEEKQNSRKEIVGLRKDLGEVVNSRVEENAQGIEKNLQIKKENSQINK